MKLLPPPQRRVTAPHPAQASALPGSRGSRRGAPDEGCGARRHRSCQSNLGSTEELKPLRSHPNLEGCCSGRGTTLRPWLRGRLSIQSCQVDAARRAGSVVPGTPEVKGRSCEKCVPAPAKTQGHPDLKAAYLTQSALLAALSLGRHWPQLCGVTLSYMI